MRKLIFSFLYIPNFDGKLLIIVMEKVLVMSASANKLGTFKQHAAQYAAAIMEELDPDHLGYIEVTM